MTDPVQTLLDAGYDRAAIAAALGAIEQGLSARDAGDVLERAQHQLDVAHERPELHRDLHQHAVEISNVTIDV